MSKHVAVQNLTHHEVARRLQLGQEPQEIAEGMCMRVELVEALIRRPAFKALLAELTDKQYEGLDKQIEEKTRDIQAEIDEQCGESMDRLTALLKSAASESVQMHIAQDFLDRGGYSKGAQEPTTVIQINPIDASVIATALKKEKAGRELLKDDKELAKSPDTLKHPMLKESNEPADDGGKGADPEPTRKGG